MLKVVTVIAIAKVCHEANRGYCAALGDNSQPAWEDAPEWQRKSAITGVEYHLAHPNSTPADSHKSWLAEKERDGWTYGPVKNPETKEHPCFVSYENLPREQQAKDYIFLSIVRALAPLVATGALDPIDHIAQFFAYAHLPPSIQEVSRPFGELAASIQASLPRNPERTVALRKLLEAKDAAVRTAIAK